MASQEPSQGRQEPLEGHEQETTLGGNEARAGEGHFFCERQSSAASTRWHRLTKSKSIVERVEVRWTTLFD
jgi:hypothetical protein